MGERDSSHFVGAVARAGRELPARRGPARMRAAMTNRPALAAVLAALLLAVPLFAAPPANAGSPVVVELFTSEGCDACPPADRYLFDLRERDGVIALAFHVDYWDYLGWTDRFAREAFAGRQRAYARALGAPMVYTPQIVVDGARHAIGSDRSAVDEAIAAAAGRPSALEVGLAWSDRRALVVSLPEAAWDGVATVWFARYAPEAESEVAAGENAGRRLVHANVVEELTAVGMWRGGAMEIMLPWEAVAGGDGDRDFGCAVVVQPEGQGPVLGAGRIVYEADRAPDRADPAARRSQIAR